MERRTRLGLDAPPADALAAATLDTLFEAHCRLMAKQALAPMLAVQRARDIYVVLGGRQSDGSYAVRLFENPLAPWLWSGAIIMALGGLTSLSDRRYRVAAPARQRQRAAAATASLLLAAVLGLALVAVPTNARAVEPSEMLADVQLESRAREISKEVRCLVCQNQSIDDSNADLAHDLRVLVRERLVAGDSDAQVKAFLVSRYGDFVLLRPPVKASTIALWATPAVALLLGLVGAGVFLRRRQRTASDTAGLTDSERTAYEKMMAERQS